MPTKDFEPLLVTSLTGDQNSHCRNEVDHCKLCELQQSSIAFVYLPNLTHDIIACDKTSQAGLPSCILQGITNWSQGRPENQVTMWL